MNLYRGTYEWNENARPVEASVYILALDFQAAIKLAETNEKICSAIGRNIGGAVGGDVRSALTRVELITCNIVQD